jgi:acyl-coenzyme A synthetase/AMP-(fatty) acid ligase
MFGHLANTSSDSDLACVRICYSAAAALTREISDAFLARFKVPIRNHYGCTEVGVMTIDLDPDPRAHGESVGRAFPGVRIRILDDAGRDLPAGEIGEIVVGSRADQRLLRQGRGRAGAVRRFYYTGDLGRRCRRPAVSAGRRKFVIDVVGQKVSPIEIEDAR